MNDCKQNWNLFTAASELLPFAREFSIGIVVHHAAFDRAVNDGLCYALIAREGSLHQEDYQPSSYKDTDSVSLA